MSLMLLSAAFGLAAAPLAFAGAQNGLSREYEVAAFDRVYFSGPGTLRLRQGHAPSLQAQATAEVLDLLVVETYDGALFIESPELNAAELNAESLIINLTLVELREVVSNGRGLIVGQSLKVANLSLEGNGAGRFHFSGLEAHELLVTGHDTTEFTVSGHVKRQVLNLEGDGDYRALNLASRSVEATVNGAGSVLLTVADLLDIRLAGAARVRYAGSPYVSQQVSGPGSIQRVEENSI
jgi:hypothetical protein